MNGDKVDGENLYNQRFFIISKIIRMGKRTERSWFLIDAHEVHIPSNLLIVGKKSSLQKIINFSAYEFLANDKDWKLKTLYLKIFILY